MIVTIGFPIVTAGAVAKLDLANESCFFQKPERVVYRRITNRWQAQKGRLENLIGGRVIFSFANDLQNRLPLSRQVLLSSELLDWFCHH
jgi:hypothetical protein